MPPRQYLAHGVRNSHPTHTHASKTTTTRRRSNGVNHTDPGPLADPVPIEEFPPPEWRTVLNSRADLGYPDFYPSRPGYGQPEDELPESFVKSGFSSKAAVNVTAESFSMHGPVFQQLQSGGLEKLMELGQQIIEQRNASMPAFSERVFRIPVRVTYNDAKRLQFLAELANPAIPLTRLMRTPVPHGFKGVDLLETMFCPPQPTVRPAPGAAAQGPKPPSDPIPIDRALWFIRVLGANEITTHRGRAQPATVGVQAPSPAAATPSSTATAPPSAAPVNSNDWYTGEFTNAFTAWLRIQLGQLVLPGRPAKAGAPPPPKAPAGVLGDEKSKARWLAKWQYSNQLLHQLYRKRLISPRLLVQWLSDFLGTANLAQLGFVSQLIHDNLVDVAEYVVVGRHCVRAACAKIDEIRAPPARATMAKVEQLLVNIVQVLYDSNPEVVLSPATWTRHSARLAELLDATTPTFQDLARRNEALVATPPVVDAGASPRRQQMVEVNKLDSIAAETDMAALCKSYFNGPCAPTAPKIDLAKLEEKVFILVNWAMGLYQLGIHRPYAVYTLLKKWQEWHEEQRAEPFDFFDILYKWLDTSAAARRPDNVLAIGIAFGEMTRQGMFSYGRYIRKLIAVGHSARSNAGPPSHHLELLRAMPIFVESKELVVQRRLILSGDADARERERGQAEEEAALESFRQELKEYVPEIFGLKRYGRSATFKEQIDYQLPSAASLNRYEFVQTRFWMFAAAVNAFKRQGSQPAMSASTFARIINVFNQCWAYSTTTDFLVKGIVGTEDEEILLIILDAIKRHADVWTCIDRWNEITTALMERFRVMQRKGRFFPPLAAVLLMLAQHNRVPPNAEEGVRAASEAHRHKSPATPAFPVDLDQSLQGLKQIIMSGEASKASALSSKMFTRHGKFSAWSEKWWATIIEAVQTADSSKADAVMAAVAHICEVEDVAGDGSLRPVVAAWLDTLVVATRLEVFGRRNVPPVVRLLLQLVVNRRLGSAVLLERLVFPELKHAATLASAAHPRLGTKRTHAIDWAVTLTQQLLLCTAHKTLPPQNLREAYIVQTARAAVFHASKVEGLISHLPVLVVLERSKVVPEKIRTQIGEIFRGLAALPQFKTAAFRNLDGLKDSFLSNDWIKRTSDSSLETGMVEGLKLMMSDSTTRDKSSTSLAIERGARYSAWRWTRVVLEMRVEFKRLTMRITNNDEPVEARQQIARIVRSSLDREASPDDMDLLVEAFRGADSVVAQEILSVGLDRLSVLLSQLLSAENQHQVEDTAAGVDLVLRVIRSAGRQERLEAATAAARDRLFNLLTVAFQSIERQVTSEDDVQLLPGAKPAEPGSVLQVVFKLLRFALALPSQDAVVTAAPRPDYAQLDTAFLHLAVALSGRSQEVFTDLDTMRDLLIYLVDSTPSSSQAAVYQALSYEMSTGAVQDLLTAHPSFASALPRPPPAFRAMALSGSHVAESEGLALDDRPWEMMEHLTPLDTPAHVDVFLSTHALKDTASIPIALFRPQLTRDEVPVLSPAAAPEPWDYASSERNLGNGAAGEPVCARQLATVLYAPAPADEEPKLAPAPASGAAPGSAPGAAPKRARNATPVSVKGTGTTTDPIDMLESSEEDEPLQKRPRTAAAAAGKTTRASTAGKVPRKAAPPKKAAAAKTTAAKAKATAKRRRSGGAE